MLSARQLEHYRREGYVTLRISGEEELAAMRKRFAEGFRKLEVLAEDNEGRRVFERVRVQGPLLEAFAATRFYRRGVAICLQVLRAPRERVLIAPLYMRKPVGGGPTIEHQHPLTGRPPLTMFGTTLWMTIDGADESNGCINVWPRSHKRGLQPHNHELALVRELRRPDKMVPVPLPPGGAVLIHDHCIHGSYENRTQETRRTAILYALRQRKGYVPQEGF